MGTYTYRATTPQGTVQNGTLAAASEPELIALLAAQNLELIEANAQRPALARIGSPRAVLQQKRMVCLHLQALLTAGAPLEEAMRTLLQNMPQGQVKDALTRIQSDILSGHAPAQAFARVEPIFDPVFLALLTAGEASGRLAETFGLLAVYLDRQNALRQAMRRAVRYPLFLFALATGVAVFMMSFVVPQVVAFLSDSGIALPLATRLLIRLADAIGWIGGGLCLVGGILFGLPAALRAAGSDSASVFDALTLRLPVWGPLIERLALARLTGSLCALLQSGLPLEAALSTAIPTLENTALIARGQAAHQALLQGASFSTACAALFDPLARQMLRIGENSGQLPRLLADIARHSEAEAQETVSAFLAALEPTLTLLVGGLMAWVVLAVLGPVYGALGPLSAGGTG